MRYRTLVFAALALATTLSKAGGLYDGIYHVPNTSTYFSVHQKGASMIAAAFSTIPASGIVLGLSDGQSLNPSRIDVWDLASGDIVGASASLGGETAYGACYGVYNVVFNSGGATLTRVSLQNTALGNTEGVDCSRLFRQILSAVGRTVSVTKVF